MEKIKNAQFPTSKKEMRAFLGLVNSIRRVIPFRVIEETMILTPLTSANKDVLYLPNDEHKQAFENVKEMLIKEPLFCHLINPKATKYLFVDASTSTGCLSAVLLQRLDGEEGEKILPTALDLDDPVHRYIFDFELPYEPCRLYTSFPIVIPTPSVRKTMTPVVQIREKNLGYRENDLKDSIYWSMLSILSLYGAQVKNSILEYRSMAVKEVRKGGILGIRLKDQSFNNNHAEYRQFLDEYERGEHFPDKDLILIQALAKTIHRCFIFISSMEEHKDQKCFRFNRETENSRPPLIFGIYNCNGKMVFLPFFHNKNLEFSLESIKGQVQIVAYLAKSVGEQFKSRPILDLEAFAILNALHSFNRYISNTKTILLTDSRVLYYLFHQRIGDSSIKIRRWVLKIICDFPFLMLHFISTHNNLADYLSRQGMLKGDLQKLCLKDVKIEEFVDKLPKLDFSLQEWTEYCTANPQYLTISTMLNFTSTLN